jgi:hypothetical protein
LSAWPAPTASTQSTIATRDGLAPRAIHASRNENASCSNCARTNRRRRSIESASTPPTVLSSSDGPSCAKKTTPTNVGECVSSNANAESTTFCIQVPMLDANAPIHTVR